MGGFVFGISNTVVNPPATAACVPEIKSSLYENSESLKCECTSTHPGNTMLFSTSIETSASGMLS